MLKKFFLAGCALGMSAAAFAQKAPASSIPDSVKTEYGKLARSSKPEDIEKVKQAISKYEEGNTEDEVTFAMRLAGTINESAVADSLNDVVVKRWPHGHQAMIAGYNNIVSTPGNAKQKLAMYNKWIRKFPEPKTNPDIVYDYARSEIASAYAAEKDVKNTRLWVSRIKEKNYKPMVQIVESKVLFAHGDTTAAEALIREGLAGAKAGLGGNPNPMAKNDYIAYLISYAQMLYDEKKYSQALPPITEAYNTSDNKEGSEELYALTLIKNDKGAGALPILSQFVKEGRGGDEDLKQLKTAYVQAKGSDVGYEAYYNELIQVRRQNIEEKLKKEMLSTDAPSFTLVDLDGNKVSLDELKGKVVVLDFWATWCGPCKRSFPAMKMAVNKYKDDPNVKFLFIDTWEHSSDPSKSVKALMDAGKYPFHVLLDTKQAKVVDQFNIHGIPAKFIIDGNGKIRYQLTGFSGSNDAAVEELSMMIESARNAR